MRKLIALVLSVCAVTAAAADSAVATAPASVAIEMNGRFTPTSATTGIVNGTWQATGAVSDSGTYREELTFEGHTIHVEKYLVGARGTIELKAQAVYDVVAGGTLAVFRAGSWQVVGGTGAYTTLHGGGQPATTPESFGSFVTGVVHVTHEGDAHYD